MPGWGCSADRTRLLAISLLSGNLTGNFATLRHLETVLALETAVPQALIEQFPTQANGKLFQRTGIFSPITGNFIGKFVTGATMPPVGRKRHAAAARDLHQLVHTESCVWRVSVLPARSETRRPRKSDFRAQHARDEGRT